MKRDATQTIWRTVVFAGAMLGAPACGPKKPASSTPPNNQTTAPATTDNATPPTDTATTPPAPGADPCAGDPCAGPRPHAGEGGGMGRGFVLS